MQPSNNLRRYNNRSGCQLPPTARSESVRIKDSAIALDKNRTFGITIRIETRECDPLRWRSPRRGGQRLRTKLKSDRPTGNFKVLGIAIAT
ncbi:hypothetical protein [Microcoleus sp. F4-D5]|uniref:hypothetical protein n=1 Tax=Microcoleus sp. F4-D5 TaxID=2818760 RepID=UPI002FD555DF